MPHRPFPSAAHPQEYGLLHRRNGFFQELQPLAPDLDAGIKRDAGEVAARPVQVGHQPRLQRIQHESNNRYRTGCRLEHGHDGIRSGDDYIRVAGHDFTGHFGITVVTSLGPVAFDDQTLSFHVTQTAQLAEKGAPRAAPARFSQESGRDCRMEHRHPRRSRRLLRSRHQRPCRRRAAEQRDELPPFQLTELHRCPPARPDP